MRIRLSLLVMACQIERNVEPKLSESGQLATEWTDGWDYEHARAEKCRLENADR